MLAGNVNHQANNYHFNGQHAYDGEVLDMEVKLLNLPVLGSNLGGSYNEIFRNQPVIRGKRIDPSETSQIPLEGFPIARSRSAQTPRRIPRVPRFPDTPNPRGNQNE